MARTLSLVVPSGHLTVGNLLGAIRQWAGDQRGGDSLYGVADLHALTTEHDPKLVHARASMAKLYASEAAWRCADRCVQAFGGRGYMRTNVAERFLRELRVDRIWEGTSEIQRMIIGRAVTGLDVR